MFEYETGSVNPVPVTWVDAVVFEAHLRNVLDAERGSHTSSIVVEKADDLLGRHQLSFLKGVGNQHLHAADGTSPGVIGGQVLHRLLHPLALFDQKWFEFSAVSQPNELTKSILEVKMGVTKEFLVE